MSVERVVTDDRIQVAMRGLDQLWAFARNVTIPLAATLNSEALRWRAQQ